MAPADEMGEIEAGEVKVEGVIEATSEMMHDNGDSEDIGTSSRQHYYKSYYVLSHSGVQTSQRGREHEDICFANPFKQSLFNGGGFVWV